LDERSERGFLQKWPHSIQKQRGIFTEGQQRNPTRIIQVLVQHTRYAGTIQGITEQRGIGAATEHKQLHEQPGVRSLRLSALHAAFLADVWRLGPTASFSCAHRLLLTRRGGPATVSRSLSIIRRL